MIDVPVVLHRQIPKVQPVQKKPWRVIKLQFTDKVVDISVDVERSVRTMQKTFGGAREEQNEEFSLMCKFSPIFVPEGASDTRGTENCGSSLK